MNLSRLTARKLITLRNEWKRDARLLKPSNPAREIIHLGKFYQKRVQKKTKAALIVICSCLM